MIRKLNEGYYEEDYDTDIAEKATELGFDGLTGEDFPFYTNSQGIVPQYDLDDIFGTTIEVELPDDPYRLTVCIGATMDRYRLPEFYYSSDKFRDYDDLEYVLTEILDYYMIEEEEDEEDAEYNRMLISGVDELRSMVEDYTDRAYALAEFVKEAQNDLSGQ